jgi:hypothetical protein
LFSSAVIFLISSAEGASTMFSMIGQLKAFQADVLFDFSSCRQVINDHGSSMVSQYK